MPPSSKQIDPSHIWVQADSFYQSLYVLCNVHSNDPQVGAVLAQPSMVIGALTIELFFKCIICLHTGRVPHTHHLRELFDKLSPETQLQILEGWKPIAKYREKEWDQIEKDLGEAIARDLPTALTRGSEAFEQIRYSYEIVVGEPMQYYLQDLPRLLGHIILQMKPEWRNLRRVPEPLPRAADC
jgi:hypothetical protein